MLLYAERMDGRFDQWEAKTIRESNISNEPNNHFEAKPSEWLWKNANQYEGKDLEQQMGTRLEQGGYTKNLDAMTQQRNEEFREASMPKTEQSEQLRQAVQEQQKRTHQR